MKIYIIEDDVSVISVLEDIVEENNLGVICGDTDGEPADIQAVLAIDPDIVLVDLLMPGRDGIQVTRELKEAGCRAKFIMLSQVSDKEMVAKAYTAGVESSTMSACRSKTSARSRLFSRCLPSVNPKPPSPRLPRTDPAAG